MTFKLQSENCIILSNHYCNIFVAEPISIRGGPCSIIKYESMCPSSMGALSDTGVTHGLRIFFSMFFKYCHVVMSPLPSRLYPKLCFYLNTKPHTYLMSFSSHLMFNCSLSCLTSITSGSSSVPAALPDTFVWTSFVLIFLLINSTIVISSSGLRGWTSCAQNCAHTLPPQS